MSIIEASDLAALLGVKPKKGAFTALDLADAVGKGLPVGVIDRLSALIAPTEPGLRYRIVPKATLTRRLTQGRLSSEESDRVARLARLWAFALDIWKSPQAAQRFLGEPHALLGGRVPLDVAVETEIGARAVENLLGGLKYGTAV